MKILIVLPVFNEELILEKNAGAVLDFCRQIFSNDEFKIVISDNRSTDKTGEIGRRLAEENNEIIYLPINKNGKGAAIRSAWENQAADVHCFMDADLATGLGALKDLVEEIKSGNDIVIGSRFHPRSKVARSFFRRIISMAYRWVIKILLRSKINDAPCGFKAINHKVKKELLAKVEADGWFFDSELVLLGEKLGYKIKEIPVDWSDYRNQGRSSTVNVFQTAMEYLRQIWQLRKRIKSLKNG